MNFYSTWQTFIFTIALSLFLLSAGVVYAQNNSITDAQTEADTVVDGADLYIDYITPHEQTGPYVPGDVVSGTFTLFNVGNQTATEVAYGLRLVTLEQIDGTYYPLDDIYVTDQSDTFSVVAGEVEIPFEITLPAILPDKTIGVLVEAFVNGSINAQEYVPIDVERTVSQSGYLTIATANLQINEQELYRPAEGPYVESDERVEAALLVRNESAVQVDFELRSTVHQGQSLTDEVVVSQVADRQYTLGVDEEMELFLPLPTSMAPGVYTAVIVPTNMTGAAVGPQIEYRYIIDGLKPRIDDVTMNAVDHRDIDDFTISVTYADVPFNPRRDVDGNYVDPRAVSLFATEEAPDKELVGILGLEDLSAQVMIYDAADMSLLQVSEEKVFVSKDTEFVFTPITSDVSEIIIVVNLNQDGALIDVYETSLGIVPAPAPEWSLLGFLAKYPLVIISLLLGVFLLISGYFIARYVRLARQKQENNIV